jgi:hypothetical protein
MPDILGTFRTLRYLRLFIHPYSDEPIDFPPEADILNDFVHRTANAVSSLGMLSVSWREAGCRSVIYRCVDVQLADREEVVERRVTKDIISSGLTVLNLEQLQQLIQRTCGFVIPLMKQLLKEGFPRWTPYLVILRTPEVERGRI